MNEQQEALDIAAEVEQQSATQAMTVRHAVNALDQTQPAPGSNKTSQEMRVVEVSEALLPAYQKASTLELSDGEVEALMAPFPDEIVECRPHDGLLYIPHIHVSDRLNRIFKPGKWALIRRREWFDGGTMFAEYVMVIRGCYVGESIGGHPYVKSNPKTNYSDVLESTAAEALRRICGKRLSCGSQVWNPEYCRQWEAKHRTYTNGKYGKRRQEAPSPKQTTAAPAQTAPTPAPERPAPTPEGDHVVPVCTVKTVTEKSGKASTTGKPWHGWFCVFDDGFGDLEAGTFSGTIGALAKEVSETGEAMKLVYRPGKRANTFEIVSLERVDQPPTEPELIP